MRAKCGDSQAFIKLIEEHKQALYKVAKLYLKNEEDIADAMQETILSAYEHLGQLKNPAYFKTWITKIMINHCNDILRNTKKEVLLEEFPDIEDEKQSGCNKEFMNLVHSLPVNYRKVFVLYYGNGFNVREIADLLGESENTVKSRLLRGRKKLKEILVIGG